jgi:cyclase
MDPDEPMAHVSLRWPKIARNLRKKRGEYTTKNGLCFATMNRRRCGFGRLSWMLLALVTATAPRVSAQQLDSVQIRQNVWVIFGAGGNVTVHVGEDGVILVDSGSEAMAEKTLAAVRAITKAPIRVIINTSADPEHVGGNDKVGAAGVAINPDNFSDEEHATVLAHENVLQRMSVPKNRNEKAAPTAMWPTETFTSKYRSFYVNDEAVQVIRQLGAVSDGDVFVHFRRADVIATGDIVDLRRFPVIDAAKGGSIQGELEALNRLLDLTVPPMPLVLKPGRTLVVPGHGRISDYGELVDYRDMVTTIKDIVEDMVKKGMTLEQVKSANPAAGYRKRYGSDSGPWTTDMFVEAIYNGLKSATKAPAGKTN